MKGIKSLIIGLLEAVLGSVVFGFIIIIGTCYNLGYALWLGFTKDWKQPFLFLWKIIDGTLFVIGRIFHQYAIQIDKLANVNGEIVEDGITHEENTTFGEPDTTISASIGKLELENKLNIAGGITSYLLNLVFWQKSHAVDSWEYKVKHDELIKSFFQKFK